MARDLKKVKEKIDEKAAEKIIKEAAANVKQKPEKEVSGKKLTTNISIDKRIWLKGKELAIELYDTNNFSLLVEKLILEKYEQLSK